MRICYAILLLILFANYKANSTGHVESVTIIIEVHGSKLADSLNLYYWREAFSENANSRLAYDEFKAFPKGNSFKFRLTKVDRIGYISIERPSEIVGRGTPVFKMYLVEPGDSIKIIMRENADSNLVDVSWADYELKSIYDFRRYHCDFIGKGYQKYKCRYLSDLLACQTKSLSSNESIVSSTYDDQLKVSIQTLNRFSNKLNPLVYKTMLVDFQAKYQAEKYDEIGIRLLYDGILKKDTQFIKKVQEYVESDKLNTSVNIQSNDVLKLSKFYPIYFIRFCSVLTRLSNSDSVSVYSIIKQTSKGSVREKLITTFLLEYMNTSKNAQTLLDDALSTVTQQNYLSIIRQLKRRLGVGEYAYNFSLPDESGNIVSLAQFKGKVVFIDFWFTGCTACIEYYTNHVSKVEGYFKDDSNVVFISISIDANKKNWQNSIEKGKYTSREVINLYTGGRSTSDPVIKEYNVIGYPQPFIIDKSGRIFKTGYELRNSKGLLENLELADQIKL